MGIENDIREVLEDPNEPFETAEQFVEATYLAFASEMSERPVAELWQEAIEGMRGADHDVVERTLDTLEMAIEQARDHLRSIEDGRAFKRAVPPT